MEERKCLYRDICERCSNCDHYYPAGDYSDAEIDRMVEDARDEYLSAWLAYTEE